MPTALPVYCTTTLAKPVMHHLYIATLCLFNPQGQLLTVRKRGTQAWMLPGGKRDGDETPLQTLLRELKEELQLPLQAADVVPLGTFSAAAANEAATQVHAEVFVALQPLRQPVQAAAEIEALQWIELAPPLPHALAPLLREHIIPALRQRSGTA